MNPRKPWIVLLALVPSGLALLGDAAFAGSPFVSAQTVTACGITEIAGAGLTGVYTSSVAWGDYDNDGDLDILLTGATTGGYVSKLYRNDGGGTFTDIAVGWPGVAGSSVAWGDYDNDGDLDILLAGASETGHVSKIYRNDGNNTFTDIGAGLTGVSYPSVAWGDYDNDGDLDILLTGGTFISGGAVRTISKIYRNETCSSNTPPSAPGNLSTLVGAQGTVFHWGPSTDDQTPSAGLHYNLRVGTTPGGNQITSPMSASVGYRRVARLGNAREQGLMLALPPGTYYWSVQGIDPAWAGSPFASEKSFTVTALDVPSASEMPVAFALRANQPNPFSARTSITFDLPRPSHVTLRIHDVSGRLVRTLASAAWPAGRHQVEWDGTLRSGAIAPNGVYFCQLEADGFRAQRRMVRLR